MRTGLKTLWRAARARARTRAEARALGASGRFSPPYRLNVGCGNVRFEGWINIDFAATGSQDLIWDVSKSIPCPDATCSMIYNEHFIEHLDIDSGKRFLRECHRVLIPGGVLRVATPSLEATVSHYADQTWKDQAWLKKYRYHWIATRAEYLNICFRHWGHQWIYDAEELSRRLREAGFVNLSEAAWGVSQVREMSGRETREESVLIFEAVK